MTLTSRPFCWLPCLAALLFLFHSTIAPAQHRLPPRPPRRPAREAAQQPLSYRVRTVPPYTSMVSVQGGGGSIYGYAEGGFGMAYERFIGRSGTLSLDVPLQMFWGSGYANGPGYLSTQTRIQGYYLAPGLLFHPMGNQRKLDLAFGLSAAAGELRQQVRTYQYYTSLTSHNDYRDPLLALAGQVHMNLHTTGGFLFGVYVRVGSVFTNISAPANNGTGEPIFLQAGIKLGGCW